MNRIKFIFVLRKQSELDGPLADGERYSEPRRVTLGRVRQELRFGVPTGYRMEKLQIERCLGPFKTANRSQSEELSRKFLVLLN